MEFSADRDKIKALFFLRHANDIDHIVPVIHKWATEYQLPAHVIMWQGLNPHVLLYKRFDLKTDYRIRYIDQIPGVTVNHISEFTPPGSQFSIETEVLEGCVERMFSHFCSPGDRVAVVFDHSYNEFPTIVTRAAKQRGYGTIAMAHGARVHINNHMLHVDDLGEKRKGPVFCQPDNLGELYDLWTTPDPSYTGLGDPRPEFRDRVRIPGSARYCQEWIDILSGFVPPFNAPKSEGKLKIAMYLRSRFYPVFWEEVGRTIKLLTNFDDVHLVVQHHPRENDFLADLAAEYPSLRVDSPNLQVVSHEVPSAALNRWADILIDLSSSVIIEGIVMGKPVLEMEYLHALHSAVAHYLPNTHMHCRDDLYNVIERYRKDRKQEFYDEVQRRWFVENFAEYGGTGVLDRYVQLVLSCTIPRAPTDTTSTSPALGLLM